MPRKTNSAGVSLIKSFEKCVLRPYDDGAGYMTIGWGHLIRRGEDFGERITQEEADELLRQDLSIAENAVERLVKVPLNDNQFAALVSFTFNVGTGGLQRSSLLRALNAGRYDEVPDRLMIWNKAKGKVLRGLTRRRAAEGALWRTPSPVTVEPPAEAPVPDAATAPAPQTVGAVAAAPAVARVTSGSGSWIRTVLTWIAGLYTTASDHVQAALGLSPEIQKILIWIVLAFGVVYLILKAAAEWQMRKIAADPTLVNVK